MTKARGMKSAAAQPSPAAPSEPPSGAGIAGAVVRMDDDTRKELEAALGTKNVSLNANPFVRASRTPFVFQGDGIHAGAEDMLNQTAMLVGIKAFKPADPVEAMIAAQAVMLHNLAMEAGRRAQLPNQGPDVANKLRKDAANLSRSMVDMAEALDRRRGKGPQTIRVERVLVQDGGQAVVAGSVTTSGAAVLASSPPQQAIGQGTPPFATGDALPVAAGDVRGRGSDDADRDGPPHGDSDPHGRGLSKSILPCALRSPYATGRRVPARRHGEWSMPISWRPVDRRQDSGRPRSGSHRRFDPRRPEPGHSRLPAHGARASGRGAADGRVGLMSVVRTQVRSPHARDGLFD